MRAMMFWLQLPLRIFSHFCRFMFGHPVPSIAILTVLVAVFSYMSTIQITPAFQANATGNAQRIVMMFPSAGVWAAVCAMVSGTLLMWIAEHFDKPITSWTAAPSIWAKPAEEPAA